MRFVIDPFGIGLALHSNHLAITYAQTGGNARQQEARKTADFPSNRSVGERESLKLLSLGSQVRILPGAPVFDRENVAQRPLTPD